MRQSDQADLLNSKGVRTILVSGLDDTEALEKAASEHDIVVNVASGRHYEGPKSLIRGLAKRREQKGADVHFIHVSSVQRLSLILCSHTNLDQSYPGQPVSLPHHSGLTPSNYAHSQIKTLISTTMNSLAKHMKPMISERQMSLSSKRVKP